MKNIALLTFFLVFGYSLIGQAQGLMLKWKYNLPNHYFQGDVGLSSDGTAFFVARSNANFSIPVLYALQQTPRAVKWKAPVLSEWRGYPVIWNNSTVYVLDAYEGANWTEIHLFALNITNGTTKWHTKSGPFDNYNSDSYISIGLDGTVFCTANSGNMGAVSAFNPITGKKKWVFEIEVALAQGCDITPIAVADNGNIYFANSNGIYALNGSTGEKIWEYFTDSSVSESPAIGDGGKIYATDGGYLIALDGATGAEIWKPFGSIGFLGGCHQSTEPVIGLNDTVYVGCIYDGIRAFDGSTGLKKWEFRTDQPIYASPTVGSDGTVYVVCGDGKLYALNGANGTKKSEFRTGNIPSSPTIGSDGVLYTVAYTDIYAIYSNSSGLANTTWPKAHSNNQNSGLANSVPYFLSTRRLNLDSIEINVPLSTQKETVLEYTSNLTNWIEYQRLSPKGGVFSVNIQLNQETKENVRLWRSRVE